ncbi:MAG TPA: beta-phosphoglucomutase family hydrolase [Solirubrobacteraceae bacterium]
MLRLPEDIDACLFDLDGVITDTARVHVRAWKQTFDAFLRTYGDPRPFDPRDDYLRYVDGKPREDGVRDFLASRGIELSASAIRTVGDEKNQLLLRLIERDGVDVYPGSVRFVRAVREAGKRTAVVSSSANTAQVLEITGLSDLFEARVDGVVIAEEHLAGKPAPDSFLRGAEKLSVEPARAAVFEDALSGVQAGRAGHFGHVVGVDRDDAREALLANGADVVVSDLEELL